MQTFERSCLDQLFSSLRRRGYTLVGPRAEHGAIVYDELGNSDDLPAGWLDEQDGGSYRLRHDGAGEALFGCTVGPHSWKRYLHPPRLRLWRAARERAGKQGTSAVTFTGDDASPERYAFLGVRACELAAIAVQDRVFLAGPYADPGYRARRAAVFVVAVQCGRAGGTCFCASMGTGPAVTGGYDIALTEVVEGGRHWFAAEAGSAAGEAVLAELDTREATVEEVVAAAAVVERAAAEMGRELATEGLPELLRNATESPCWAQVAERCLTCGNCTLVCPTCFCTTVEDHSDLAGVAAERWRRWDSCFNTEFSYIHGGAVRASAAARYRQWMTHKLGTWVEQFGTSGCVGCGRCITWCPVGIDITEEARGLRAAAGARPPPAATPGG